jgi:hypothetical protein
MSDKHGDQAREFECQDQHDPGDGFGHVKKEPLVSAAK